MSSKGPEVSPVIAASVICLLIGAAVGFYTHAYGPSALAKIGPSSAQPAGAAGGGGMGMARGMGGPPGGGGGFGGGGGGRGGGPPTGGAALARLVRGLDLLQEAQGKAITPAQAKTLLPLLQQDKTADKIVAADADKQVASIQQMLTPEQKQALDDLQPQRGGRGGGGGGAPGGGGGFGGGGGGGFGGGGGGGARPDPDKPFAVERNQKSLDNLIAAVGK